jgi:hypothetical protein
MVLAESAGLSWLVLGGLDSLERAIKEAKGRVAWLSHQA